MNELLESLGLLLSQRAPQIAASLAPAADPTAIATFEDEVGHPLPADLREAYEWHDGQDYDDPECRYLLAGYAWIGLKDVSRLWRTLKEVLQSMGQESRQDDATLTATQRVRYDWWNTAWIPVGDMKAGDCLFVDLAPGPAGRVGQLVSWSPDSPDGHIVLAESLQTHLRELTERLRRGLLTYSDQSGCWVEAESGREVRHSGRWTPSPWA